MPNDIDKTIPNGVIFDPKPTDFVSGDGNLGTLPARNWVPNNDWTPFVPKGERQSGNGFDTNDCTGFGLTNSVECQFKYMRLNGQISVDNLTWLSQNGYLDENGDCNFSDRALGSLAGTTQNGNSLNTVAQTARDCGLIPESKWPSVFTNYADYYKLVPQELLTLGQEFKKRFTINYEYVPSSTDPDNMTGAPFYVALVTCSGWTGSDPVPWCNRVGSNHCVVELKQNPYSIFDSYPQFVKHLGSGYQIPYKYRVYFSQNEIINLTDMKLVKDTKSSTVGILTGNHDKRILAFANIEALGLLGDEPQEPMDFTGIPIYNIVKNDPSNPGQFLVVKK